MESSKAEVLATNEAFYRAFEKKDLQAMTLIWSQGTGSSCVHPGSSLLQSWSAVRQSWEAIFANTDYLEIDFSVLSLELGDRVAYVLVEETVLQISQRRRLEAQSLATNIFQKLGPKWYLTHHHGSPIVR